MSKKMVFMLLMAALAAGFVGGTLGSQMGLAKAKTARVLKAQEFRLLDAQGTTRASLDLTSKGHLYVALYNPQGKATDSMVVTPKMIQASKKTAATLRKLDKLLSGFGMKN